MKKILASILVGAALLACKSHAQAITSTNTLSLNMARDWVAIPYVKYDITDHKFGYGGAALYKVNDFLWTGFRADRLDGQDTTAGVQAQIQATVTYDNVSFTPFLEASVGLGSSSLYGSTGPGLYTMLYNHKFSNSVVFNVGVIADYEHTINGSQNYNSFNAGPLLNLSF
jgi:hypothetical protein